MILLCMFCSCSHAASDDDEKTIGEKSRVTLCFHLFLTIRQTHSYFTTADLNCHCIELCICCMTMVVGNKSLQRQTQCVIVALCPPLHWGGSLYDRPPNLTVSCVSHRYFTCHFKCRNFKSGSLDPDQCNALQGIVMSNMVIYWKEKNKRVL